MIVVCFYSIFSDPLGTDTVAADRITLMETASFKSKSEIRQNENAIAGCWYLYPKFKL